MSGIAFAANGATHFPSVMTAEDGACLCEYLQPFVSGRPGKRLTTGVQPFLEPLNRLSCSLLGQAAVPVRAVIFDKTSEINWTVAWHQDRTIAVRERRETDGFGPWSTKDGIVHVEPPVAILERMVTLRLHLDDCGEGNAPLKVAVGSHRLGLVPADQAAKVANRCEALTCLARAGDVWAYATLILHTSERSRIQGRRRVLQVDYAACDLPGGLAWRGLA